MRWITVLLLLGSAFAQELTLKKVIEDTLSGNLELKAEHHEVKSLDLEFRSARGNLFPNIKLEETFTRTNVPAYVLFTKLNQENIGLTDFAPSKLNDPDPINNYETKLSVEIPIWMGGKIRAYKDIIDLKKSAQQKKLLRKEEEVIFKAYEAFLGASLAKSAVGVAKKNLEDAKEHKRIAQKLNKVGMALLSDILRVEVYVKKAEEKLTSAQNNYRTALKALGLMANTNYDGYEVSDLNACPSLSLEDLKVKALKNREDLLAMEDYLKVFKKSQRAQIGDMLPQIAVFASYHMYDKDRPFGSQGNGYMVGVNLSMSFNTGLSSFYKARSFKEKERAMAKRINFMRNAVLFQVEKAYTQYQTSLSALNSAKARLESAEEMVRILKVRYKNGLARMVDLLSAQTQLENARFDYIQALYQCHLNYGKAIYEAGIIKEVLR